MSYQNTGKPNGRPRNTERDQKIIADRIAGMSFEDIAEKYGLTFEYTRKIAGEHERKERVKKQAEVEQAKAATGLYVDRDNYLMAYYNTLNAKGSLSKFHIQSM